MSDIRLDEYDREEWYDVARRLKPLTREEFDEMWAEFCAMKDAKALNRSVKQ